MGGTGGGGWAQHLLSPEACRALSRALPSFRGRLGSLPEHKGAQTTSPRTTVQVGGHLQAVSPRLAAGMLGTKPGLHEPVESPPESSCALTSQRTAHLENGRCCGSQQKVRSLLTVQEPGPCFPGPSLKITGTDGSQATFCLLS